MDNLISRQAAIDAYGDWYVEEGTEEGFIGTVKQLLEGLPSAQPERKTGTWIDRIADYRLLYFCSECGEIGSDLWNFCPYCGSDMRGENDETD